MKKVLLMTIAIVLVIASVCALAACNKVENAEELSFDVLPESVYVLNADISNFAIALRKGDDQTILEYFKYRKDITVEGFDTSTEGTREARVTYAGQTITFSYTVKAPSTDSDFSAGAGTEENPFVVKSEADFLALGKAASKADTAGVYYELGSDITLTATNGTYVFEDTFEGVLSGGEAQYKITVNKSNDDKNATFLFKSLKNATVKDLKLEFNANAPVTFARYAEGVIEFDNVDAYGNIFTANNNYSVYLTYNFSADLTESAKTTFNKCENHVNVNALSYIGGFVAFANYVNFNEGDEAGYLTFNNCANYGNISGTHVGVLVCNASPSYVYNISVKNFTNYGTIGYTVYGDLVCGVGYNTLNAAQKEAEVLVINVKNGENGQVKQFETVEAELNEDGFVQFTAPEGTKKAAIVLGYYGNLTSGTQYVQGVEQIDIANAGFYTNSELKLLDVKPLSDADITAAGYEYIKGLFDWKAQEIDGEYFYIHNNSKTFACSLRGVKSASSLNVYVFCIDENGVITNSKKVQ